MPSPEVWKLRGFLYIENEIKPLPPKIEDLSEKEFIRKVVWSMNQSEGFGIVEMFKEPVIIDPNSTSLLPTAYEFESAVSTNSILPTVNPNHG